MERRSVRRGRGGRLSHRRAAQRRLGRRLGRQLLTASATCRRCPPGSPTSRSRRASDHTVARRSDGSVVAWGDNADGQCNVPALPAGLTYVEVAAGCVSHGGAPERRLGRRVGRQRLRPVQRAGASGRAHLRRGRGGRRSHGGAPERRLGRRVGGQRLRPVQRAGAAGRAHLRRGRGGRLSHGGAPERRLGRRVGRQRLRPVQRAGAPGRAHLRRGRGGRRVTRSRAAATARSSRGETTPTASATCRRFPAGLTYVEVAAGDCVTRSARRSDGSVVAWGDNAYGQCNVPALPAGLTYVEVAAGWSSHGGAPQRRLGRRVGRQRLRPVQRAGASRRAHLRRGRGGRCITRWRAGATARSWRGETTATASATCRRCPAGLTYVEVAAGGAHTRRAPERRLGRRVGRQLLRPVQRAGASGRAHLRRGRGGR